jgi:hypothetical protein
MGNIVNEQQPNEHDIVPREEHTKTSLEAAAKREQAVEADFLETILSRNGAMARNVVDVYESATDLVDAVDMLLVRHALKCGFDREAAFEAFGEKTFREAYAEVRTAAEHLAAIYFLNNPATRNDQKYAAIVTNTQEFVTLLRDAQSEGKVSANLLARDAFKLIAQNITAISLQDKGSEVTTIVELDAHHLMEHDLRGCMQLADTLIEHGCRLSAMDKLLLHQSMVYHCVGYMVPPVLEAIAEKGMNGKQLGVPMLAAHYIRNQYDDPNSAWKCVFPAEDFELLHRAVLYQDRGGFGTPEMALRVADEVDEAVRTHNIEAILRIAHRAPEGVAQIAAVTDEGSKGSR